MIRNDSLFEYVRKNPLIDIPQLKHLLGEPCPDLFGTFEVYLFPPSTSEPGRLIGTVRIDHNGEYRTSEGDTGRLTRLQSGNFRYEEAGPPPISGTLHCFSGTWLWYEGDDYKGFIKFKSR